jgi:glycosyltransferase involved in cell wall biosynthesis
VDDDASRTPFRREARTNAMTRPHVLVYEPRTEGHHLYYLRFIVEDLVAAGHRLTVAVDMEGAKLALVRDALGELIDRVALADARDPSGRNTSSAKARRIAALLAETNAAFAFLPNLDEIASDLLRRAAIGLMPPPVLRGRLAGIYHRPRVLDERDRSLKNQFKRIGFERLLRSGWFAHILLVDPYLAAHAAARYPQLPASFLPDSYPDWLPCDRLEARGAMSLPPAPRMMLFYGTGHARKGLDLVVSAMRRLPATPPIMLCCAGRQHRDPILARRLDELVQQGRARVIDRYITTEEERLLFAACDLVLLPYRGHFGISGVMVRAIGAGAPVIVSDEGLLGRLARDHALGLWFPSGDVEALAVAIARAARATDEELSRWRASVQACAPGYSRANARSALLAAIESIESRSGLRALRSAGAA